MNVCSNKLNTVKLMQLQIYTSISTNAALHGNQPFPAFPLYLCLGKKITTTSLIFLQSILNVLSERKDLAVRLRNINLYF